MVAASDGPGPAGMGEPSQCTVYHKLGTSSSIRLLKLHKPKNEASAAVRADLAVFDITDHECPPFTTVSYTWGEGHSDEHINLNGHYCRVLKTLAPLLRMLCSEENQDFDLAEHWFWIDSICINQADLTERAAQVKLMTSIYRKAQRTLVWLAEGSEDTHQALDFLHTLRDKRHTLRQAVKKRFKHVPEDLHGHPGWASLERLLQRPWWRRVWTLQEFIIPERLRFYCGAKSISRSEFRQGMAALELCGPLEQYIREQVWMTAWNRRRIIDWYQDDHHRHRIPLVSLMAFCGDHGAKVDQDRVWAVHGLARQEDRDMIGPPTYEDPVHSLYARLVKSFVDRYGSLDIICYSQLFFTNTEDPSWPSWVPDWRVEIQRPSVVPLMVSQSASPHLANLRPPKPHRHPSLLRPSHKAARASAAYKASGNKTARGVRFCDALLRLTCQGVRLDVVDGLGTSSGDYRIAAESTSPINTTGPLEEDENEDTIRKMSLYSVARALVLDRQDQFLETVAPARQFLRELKILAAACATNNDDDDVAAVGASDRESSAESEEDTRTRSAAVSPTTTPLASPSSSSQKAAAAAAKVPPWFAAWWKDNNTPALRIRGFTLEQLCQADEPGFNLFSDPMQQQQQQQQQQQGQGQGQGHGQRFIRKTSKSFYARFRGTMKAAPRRLMVTAAGRVGVAPRQAKKGDVICVLFGASVPVLLRPYPRQGGDDDTGLAGLSLAGMYEFVGECFVDGFMDGEALHLGTPVEDFTLR